MTAMPSDSTLNEEEDLSNELNPDVPLSEDDRASDVTSEEDRSEEAISSDITMKEEEKELTDEVVPEEECRDAYKLKMAKMTSKAEITKLKKAKKIDKTLNRDKIWSIFWKIVIVAVIAAFCNPKVHKIMPIITNNIADFVYSLYTDDNPLSNKAAESLRKLGKELNEINGYDYGSDRTDEGFSIDNAG